MQCNHTCKFIPNANRTRYSGLDYINRCYDDDEYHYRLFADIISVNERDPWIRCGLCPFDYYNLE